MITDLQKPSQKEAKSILMLDELSDDDELKVADFDDASDRDNVNHQRALA